MTSKEENLKSILIKFKERVDPIMEKFLRAWIAPKFQQLVRYQISTDGKRLRPALAILSCKLLGGELKDVLYPAAGLEMLHNYTLIVDDIIDHSLTRRGKPTVWAKYGKSITGCIGIDFGASVFQAANCSSNPTEISELFAKTMKTIAEGEILDILFERYGREEEPYVVKNRFSTITQKQYVEMVSKKTAYLFQTCCEVGGVCARANKKEIGALKRYGFNLGVAFQIQDDILDIFGEEKKFGKKIGKDVEERKGGNIVLIFALKKLQKNAREKIFNAMKKKKIKEKEKKEIINLLQKTKALEKSLKLGEEFVEKAKLNLKSLPQNKWNQTLKDLADFAIKRRK